MAGRCTTEIMSSGKENPIYHDSWPRLPDKLDFFNGFITQRKPFDLADIPSSFACTLADKYGRKPVINAGLVAVKVFLILNTSLNPYVHSHPSRAAAGVVNDRSIADSRELHSLHRKLLGGDSRMKKINRIWGDKCTTTDIVISQGITRPLPNGVPTYSVEIINTPPLQ
ncbi:hypothetical protein SAY86_025470 [Trapa natans]|uniref:Uncharacterized protein n=1 Tax=Trapa natans TaxID=22666 RepID=A0AAN7RF23_TRANT|nr:hypothetical protein SAY86_025470 [Trapa natans]